MGSLVFDELAICYPKHDLKYYQNLFKVVSQNTCFIIGCDQPANWDLYVTKILNSIESTRQNIELRNSLMHKETSKVSNTDIEIVCTEWQGTKMVYVIEVWEYNRPPFWRIWWYNFLEETDNKVVETFPNLDVPPISKKAMINTKTELVERRMINFELFL